MRNEESGQSEQIAVDIIQNICSVVKLSKVIFVCIGRGGVEVAMDKLSLPSLRRAARSAFSIPGRFL